MDRVTLIPWLGHTIELAAVVLFVWVWWDAGRRRPGLRVELVVALVYGWLLEALDMLFFGTYHYGRLTWWWLGDVPVYIPLLWATIVHSSMALSDRIGLAPRARPLLDGVLAVLIDLAVDAIAIRVGLWAWKLRLDEGWFGVPAGNLCAWMFVASWYSVFVRWMRAPAQRRPWLWAAVPPLAYAGLFLSLMAIGRGGQWLGWDTPGQRLWMFAAQMAAYFIGVAAALRRGRTPGPPVPVSFLWTRWLIHATFFGILLATGMARRVPGLAAATFGSMLLEWVVQWWAESRRRVA